VREHGWRGSMAAALHTSRYGQCWLEMVSALTLAGDTFLVKHAGSARSRLRQAMRHGSRTGTGVRCDLCLCVSTAGAAAWLPHSTLRDTVNAGWKWYPL